MRERANQRGMSTSYLEGNYDHDDDNAVSISAIKKRYKQETSKRMHFIIIIIIIIISIF